MDNRKDEYDMLTIGCHLSISKGYFKAGQVAKEIGANSFQFFTRNPRGGKAKDIDIEDVKKFDKLREDNNFGQIVAHAPYTMNLCSDKESVREFANEILKDDLKRMKMIKDSHYVFHPGSHIKQGKEIGIRYIIDALNDAIDEENNISILLESMSGKGSEIGDKLEDLNEIIKNVRNNKNLGVCLDTCHLYSSGYDIVSDLDGVLDSIDRIIGLNKVKVIHLNDSKTEFSSNKDRHETIGDGTIGIEVIKKIINHPKLKDKVFILETPTDEKGHAKEIEKLV